MEFECLERAWREMRVVENERKGEALNWDPKKTSWRSKETGVTENWGL